MKAKELMGLLRGLEDFDLKNCAITTEILDALDAQPVVHGHWIKNEGRYGWHCSVCKVDDYYAYSWNSETGKDEFQDNFCPNCGAKQEADNA